MPKQRKSLSELVETGTLHRNLGRYQARITAQGAVLSPIGRAPVHLGGTEKAVWTELVRSAPAGLLTKGDRVILEIAVRLLVRVRSVDVKQSEISALVGVLGKLGFSPTDRQRMALEPQPGSKSKAQTEQDAEWDLLDELD